MRSRSATRVLSVDTKATLAPKEETTATCKCSFSATQDHNCDDRRRWMRKQPASPSPYINRHARARAHLIYTYMHFLSHTHTHTHTPSTQMNAVTPRFRLYCVPCPCVCQDKYAH